MKRNSDRPTAFVARTALLAALFGCSGGTSTGGSDPQELVLAAATPSIPNDGSWVLLTIKATSGQGKPADDYVGVTATHGDFRGYSGDAAVFLEKGEGAVEYRCVLAQDRLCTGKQVIRGSWLDLYSSVTVDVGAGP